MSNCFQIGVSFLLFVTLAATLYVISVDSANSDTDNEENDQIVGGAKAKLSNFQFLVSFSDALVLAFYNVEHIRPFLMRKT